MKAAVARAAFAAFGAVTVVHLGALLAGAGTVAHVTKPALMPLLALYAVLSGGPRLLAAALLLGCAGDTLLLADGGTLFLLGMGGFAAGHVCYLLLFARHGSRPRHPYRVAVPYAAAWIAVLVLLWPGLDAGMRLPVAVYSLLLTATGLCATSTGLPGVAGGLLFLLSDTLLAGRMAGWPQAPAPQFWVMATYVPAQCLLALAVLAAAAGRTEPGNTGGTGAMPPGPSRSRARTRTRTRHADVTS
ncbi:hypothetical protein GCM10010218_61940 [Streptomyces mashuensis]|uniref:Lysoplasmalogenase n=1 Tax=Streptomyces mashuensis TaxID=33904 RepID=A0A919B9I7_9ACTN|nr:lysoplasmalogenase [Streptomyces mashuensis]GHF72258.1 hypothetical protein GCM10010218_61940 [Streptomyces mashuensis]